jgi:hypothetical protein
MDLPNLFSSATELETRIQICIVLNETTVQALLLKITMEESRILQKSPVLAYSDPETLLVRTDEALQELGKESENINEVLFVLEPAWLKDGDVVVGKKPLLQKITTELALRPIGFLLQSEAIIQNLLAHNPHFSAVLLLITSGQIAVTVLTQGKVGAPHFVGRSSDIASDLQEAFARYLHEKKQAHLPGKLICASFTLTAEELIAAQQRLLDTSWGEKAPFVQAPTIDIIKPDLALSILAQQAGNAVMGLQKAEIKSMESRKPTTAHSSQKEAVALGFSAVGHSNLATVDDQERAVEVAKDFLPTSFGIPIKQTQLAGSDDEELAVEVPGTASKKSNPGSIGKLFGTTKTKHNTKLFIVGGFIAGLLAVGVGSYLWLLFFTRVEARIVPITKTIASDVTLTLDPKLPAPDPENLRIPAAAVTKTIKTQVSGTTSGIKIVGDKAKGEVTIYNKTAAQKTFAAGTVLQSGELQFVLEKEVTVDAATVQQSSSNSETKTFGEAKVAASAYVIGVESNIAEGQELTVANFDKSTYVAKSVGAFTGGSSREIRVVAQLDRDQLLAEAKKNILKDAQDQFTAESGNGTFILPTDEVVIKKATYSDELEAAADELVLDAEGTVTALSYKVADLVPLAQAVLGSKVPAGFMLSNDDPEILSAPSKNSAKQGVVVLEANLSATAVPQLDPSSLTLELAGKSVSEVPAVFANTGVIKSSSILFNPPLAARLLSTVPNDKSRITVVWDTQE